MRSTQIIGLSQEAKNYLSCYCKQVSIHICPDCNHKYGGSKFKKEKYDSAAEYGMFGDGPNLYKYKLKDGSFVKEIVQAVPWSSGPCIFLCLEKEDGTKIGEWSEEDINNV